MQTDIQYSYRNIALNSSYNEEVFRLILQGKSKHTFCIQKIFLKYRAVYEIMWENVSRPDRPQITIKYGACALRAKAIDTRSKYIIVTAFPGQHWLRERDSI